MIFLEEVYVFRILGLLFAQQAVKVVVLLIVNVAGKQVPIVPVAPLEQRQQKLLHQPHWRKLLLGSEIQPQIDEQQTVVAESEWEVVATLPVKSLVQYASIELCSHTGPL